MPIKIKVGKNAWVSPTRRRREPKPLGQLRLSRSLVLKLSKSGSGIWAPNSLSLDHIWKSGFPKTYKTALRSPEATIFSTAGAPKDRHRYRRPSVNRFCSGRELIWCGKSAEKTNCVPRFLYELPVHLQRLPRAKTIFLIWSRLSRKSGPYMV